jgi:uncharacterized membrane protein
MHGLSKAQRVGIFVLAAGFVIGGTLHLIKPEPYIRIMPPYLPWHSELVAISGFFEILGGMGLLFPQVRRSAAWGLVALMIAVFPANIYMAANPAQAGAASIPAVLLWTRLPLQFVFIWWVLWCTRYRLSRE